VSDVDVPGDVLAAYVADILVRLGARPQHASRVGRALVAADLSGHVSHGVRQLPYYAGQVRDGEIDVAADPEILDDRGGMVVVDGCYGFGHVVAEEATELARERAATHGFAAVGVRHANHVGRLGAYTEAVAEAGQVGIMFVNCEGSNQMLAPFGGVDRRVTNNPISMAVPGPQHPLVLDMALSAVAESKVLQAHERGADVPAGWVLDADGRPSTSPADYVEGGGTLVPVGGLAGGHKGYALIVLVELIVGMLSGGPICGPEDRRFSNGFVLLAIDPGGTAARPADVSGLVGWIKSSRVRDGFGEILVPGELEARTRRERAGMVPLDATTVGALEELARSAGIDAPLAGPAPARG
jgi:hydroxycarboxylate dehydrogenase B